eukprot:s2874_g7.t2
MVTELRSGIQELLIRKPLVQSIPGSAAFLVFSSSEDSESSRESPVEERLGKLLHKELQVDWSEACHMESQGVQRASLKATSGVGFHSSPPKVGTGAPILSAISARSDMTHKSCDTEIDRSTGGSLHNAVQNAEASGSMHRTLAEKFG